MQPIEVKKPERKLSPLLEKEERELLWNNALGHSLDSKQVASALGYLDLKQICLCLAHALMRHIQFSQGFYFLDDLQEQIKALQLEDELKLEFSYEIPQEMKIDIEGAKRRKRERDQRAEEEAKKEYEELKAKLAMGVSVSAIKPKKPFDYQRAAVGQSVLTDDDQFERAGDIEEEVKNEDEE